MMYLSAQELTSRAGVVVRGQVVRQQEVMVQGRLWTDYYIKVLKSIKGSQAGRELIIRRPGGETISIGMHVAGAARYHLNEEVLVFARPVGKYFVTVGMCLGKFQIYRDAAGTERTRRDLTGAAFARFTPSGRMVLDHPHQLNVKARVPLAKLLRTVRAQMRKGGAR